MEGKVEHKFGTKPHKENIEYGKLCRERTNKSMIKNRQIQVAHLTCIFFFLLLLLWPFFVAYDYNGRFFFSLFLTYSKGD